MRDHRPTSTESIISGSKLHQLQEHAELIHQLNQLLVSLLPKGTANQCRAANIRNGFLIIEVASAAIKMKLDYERLSILNQLRANGFARLSGIEVRINPELYRQQQEQEKPVKKRPPLSDSAASSILTTAGMATSPKLKARLENIARLAKKGDE
ncbi:DUF721 domain-containing protein [Vibrio albus]|uniref:DUF721 domain-containing protein n=1 Tax=Vibrio albus TaxID=2200953 RepID=A0A2U3B5X9_9VIBR|nr:DciA family protein [Vibrio albus]PWI32124.1 DUF721 domain-containing protein [Vibrio albus]